MKSKDIIMLGALGIGAYFAYTLFVKPAATAADTGAAVSGAISGAEQGILKIIFDLADGTMKGANNLIPNFSPAPHTDYVNTFTEAQLALVPNAAMSGSNILNPVVFATTQNPAGTLLPQAVALATGTANYSLKTNTYTSPQGYMMSVAPAKVGAVAAQFVAKPAPSPAPAGNLLTQAVAKATGKTGGFFGS